jgi:L-ascorbate metabolism protein UlaG (beta-lactamase superfamily)
VQASIDLQANILFPIHWGKFALAFHDWNEPIKRVLKKAEELNVKVTTPMIGEPLRISKYFETKLWWKFD